MYYISAVKSKLLVVPKTVIFFEYVFMKLFK